MGGKKQEKKSFRSKIAAVKRYVFYDASCNGIPFN